MCCCLEAKPLSQGNPSITSLTELHRPKWRLMSGLLGGNDAEGWSDGEVTIRWVEGGFRGVRN